MPKASSKSKREVSDSSGTSDSDSGPDDVRPAKKSRPSEEKKSRSSEEKKSRPSEGSGKSSCEVVNGEPTWTIAPKRFVKIRTFNGRKYVDIREYWNDDKGGELKPGKKGISMSMEQFDLLTQYVPEINQRL